MEEHVPTPLITRVCILGERVSGTCFIQTLLSSNSKIKLEKSYGHKHFFQDVDMICNKDTTNVLFVFVTRDIVSWLSSMKNTPYHTDLPIRRCTDFSKFIRMEWVCIYDKTSGTSDKDKKYGTEMINERDPYTGERFENIIKMRTSKIDHCMAIGKIVENFIHVKYEDVNEDPEKFIRDLSEKFNIPTNPMFRHVKTIKGVGNSIYVPKNYPMISEDDESFIQENIDECTEKYVGYM